METSINNQSGGIAAEITTNNPEQTTNQNHHMSNQTIKSESTEETVTLKNAAVAYDCAWTSLKNNIKSNKLAASQANKKAPYLVRLSDVERFLRDTPGIASVFHPAAGKLAATNSETPPSVPEANGRQPHAVKAQTVEPIQPTATAMKTAPVDGATAANSQEAATMHAADDTKRRRRRRRGKGGSTVSCVTLGSQSMSLKALAGATPQERLRITACLNEIASLVASV